MRRHDLLLVLIFLCLFLPFFFSGDLYQLFVFQSKTHPFILAFFKFAILATLGETIGYRIKSGKYPDLKFGFLPRAVVWGFLGVTIAMAFKIFGAGTPFLLTTLGLTDAPASMAGDFSSMKLLTAFSISVAMNLIYAPMMMTTHKITDIHIESNGGKLLSLVKPIQFSNILSNINWKVQWNFVFKKTIPLFWIPAHTLTFLLATHFQVLFAAVLSVFLGIILAAAAVMNKKESR